VTNVVLAGVLLVVVAAGSAFLVAVGLWVVWLGIASLRDRLREQEERSR
jgi:uncharacterized membrane protein